MKKLMEMMKNRKIKDGDFLDEYNQIVVDDGTCEAITVGISFRNHQFVAEETNEEERTESEDV